MRCLQTRRRSIAPLLLLLAAVASCAAPQASAPAPWTERPRVVLDDEAIAALAELLRAEDRRSLDSLRVAELLRHPLPVIRERAALAVGRIGDRRASRLLVRALDDSTRAVAAAAAFALGELGDTSSMVLYALAQKLGVSWGENDVRGVEAVAALGKIGSPGAHAALRQVLQRYTGSDAETGAVPAEPIGETGKEALLTIWRFPRSETDVDLVVPHLTSSEEEVRWRATYVFTRIESPRAVPNIRDRLTDSHPLVRALAARALRASVVDSAQQRAETVEALRTALADPHPHVQINAARALATYADSRLAPALDVVLASKDTNVRIAAIQALGRLGGGAVEPLIGIARDTARTLAERVAAVRGIIRLAPNRGIAEAAAWARSEDWLRRLYAARAVQDSDWHAVAQLVRRLAEDPDGRVAAAAIRAATALTDSVDAPYALYVQALASNDAAVRAAAATGLGRRRSAVDLATLLEAYERTQRDSANDAALAIVDALAALETADVPASRSFLLRFQPSSDAEVRRRVARHFGADAWGGIGENEVAGRPFTFYQRIIRDIVAPDLAYEDRPQATIRTAAGTIVIELAAARAPLTVHNFITLATNGSYPTPDETGPSRLRWHRVVPNFMIQDGDPGGGGGGPGYSIRDEINRLRFSRGVVGVTRPSPHATDVARGPRPAADVGGSQYFITHSPQPQLDGTYTAFGRVVAGMDVVDRVVQDDPIHSIEIVPVKPRETS